MNCYHFVVEEIFLISVTDYVRAIKLKNISPTNLKMFAVDAVGYFMTGIRLIAESFDEERGNATP
jgi:hypothetical protein